MRHQVGYHIIHIALNPRQRPRLSTERIALHAEPLQNGDEEFGQRTSPPHPTAFAACSRYLSMFTPVLDRIEVN